VNLAGIPFLNAAPYYSTLEDSFLASHRLIHDSPRDLGAKARRREVDAGLLSLVDLWALEDDGLYEPLGSLGIAGKGEILSILLFGVADPAGLEGKRIAVTGQTSTSVRLMALWLKEKIGIKKWTPVELGSEADAALLIGDQALARRLSSQGNPADPAPIDLCAEWTRWTGLPFVFARWGARRDLAPAQKQELLNAVTQALNKAEADWAGLAAKLALSSGFPAALVLRYLRGIRYRLGPEEEAGMREFRLKLENAGL
jgi:chorismate dehydratase